jgi:hypothetical protein
MIEDPDLDRRANGGRSGSRRPSAANRGRRGSLSRSRSSPSPSSSRSRGTCCPRQPPRRGRAGVVAPSGAATGRATAPADRSDLDRGDRDREGRQIDLPRPGTWRTATIEQWHADQTVRVWRALDPGPRPAHRPVDQGCARGRRDRPGDRLLRAGHRAGSADRSGDGRRVAARRRRRHPDPAPPDGPAGRSRGWARSSRRRSTPAELADGVYVFRHTVLASNLARWFAVESGPTARSRSPRPGRRRRSCSRAASERSSCPDRRVAPAPPAVAARRTPPRH